MKRLENLEQFMQMLDDCEIERFLEILKSASSKRSSEIINFLLELQDRKEFALTHTTFGDWDTLPDKISAGLRERKLKQLLG